MSHQQIRSRRADLGTDMPSPVDAKTIFAPKIVLLGLSQLPLHLSGLDRRQMTSR